MGKRGVKRPKQPEKDKAQIHRRHTNYKHFGFEKQKGSASLPAKDG